MALEDYYFTPLQMSMGIKPFKCKDNDLNGFLLDDALKYLEDLMAVTYLWEDLDKNKTLTTSPHSCRIQSPAAILGI